MSRIITVCVAVLSIALLSAAGAGAAEKLKSAKGTAAKQCAAEKKADKVAFKATYGKRAMRTCQKGPKAEDVAEFKNAARACKAERDADAEGFRETYGTKNGKNALGKCISSKVKKAEEEEEVPTA